MSMIDVTRALRKDQTPDEKIVWELVRNRRFHQLKFRRQVAIECGSSASPKRYIVDFLCHEIKLILEIDGDILDTQIEYDNYRETRLKELGYEIGMERIFSISPEINIFFCYGHTK